MKGRSILAVFISVVTVGGCADPPPAPTRPTVLRVVSNPYGRVQWSTAHWLSVQLHDHVGTDTARIRAYDRAGYSALSLMTYSGVDSLPFAWRERKWPVDKWLPIQFLASLRSAVVWFPNGEEVGFDHLVSPFLARYIRRSTTPGDGGYSSTQEGIEQIRSLGGLPILAHPWTGVGRLSAMSGLHGLEVYSANAEYRRVVVRDPAFVSVDRNIQMLSNWDTLLMRDPALRGVAVNDHFGPDNTSTSLPASIRDSGKIYVIAEAAEANAVRDAVERGQFVAVRDLTPDKAEPPLFDSLRVSARMIEVFGASGSVRWIGNGRLVWDGPRIAIDRVSSDLKYVRAEIVDPRGLTVFTQAFALEPVQ